MTITVPDEYATLPASGRRLATIGNRVGSLGEYATLVDRDQWLEANLARRSIVSIGGEALNNFEAARSYLDGDRICSVYAPMSQPCRGVRIIVHHWEVETVPPVQAQINWRITDADTLVVLASGTFGPSAINVRDVLDVTLATSPANIIFLADVTADPSHRVNVMLFSVRELPLQLGDLP